MNASLETARLSIRPYHRKSEAEVLAPCLVAAAVDGAMRRDIVRSARSLLDDLRAVQADGWVNSFLQQYRLGTEEGTALLSLAEAFLRVPDPQTADLLIADNIGSALKASTRSGAIQYPLPNKRE